MRPSPRYRHRPAPRPRADSDGSGRTEPVRAAGRPTGMLTVNVRRAVPAVVLAASLALGAAACGDDAPAGRPSPDVTDDAPSSVTPSTGGGSTTATDGDVDSRVVYFSSAERVRAGVHEVLHDRGELDRFAGEVAADDADAAAKISAGGGSTDFSRYALVGWTRSTGCSTATSVTLSVSGSLLKLHVNQPKPPPECLVDFRVTVVFEVPKERIPARPAFS